MPAVGSNWTDAQIDALFAYTKEPSGRTWRRMSVDTAPYRGRLAPHGVRGVAHDRRPQADRDPLHRGRRSSSSLVGGILALLMRTQLAHAERRHPHAGLATTRLLTMHGTTMIFLFVVPLLAGFGNYLVPLMIGARGHGVPAPERDVLLALPPRRDRPHAQLLRRRAAPATPAGRAYPPLSTPHAPGNGQDLWILGAAPAHDLVGSLGAINFIVTIHNMRAPGMTLDADAALRLVDARPTPWLLVARRCRARGGADDAPARPPGRARPTSSTRPDGGNAAAVPARVLVLRAPRGLRA